ncbi:hypothetical protein ABID58_000880, partial [Bradyrhizobium sp. S3.2.6]
MDEHAIAVNATNPVRCTPEVHCNYAITVTPISRPVVKMTSAFFLAAQAAKSFAGRFQ